MKKYCLALLLLLTVGASNGQVGGYGIFKFLNLPPSSRIAALGGNLISVKDDDVSQAVQNPSLLNPTMNDKFALSYINYLAGISLGSVVYAHTFDSIGTFSGGMQYINYGDFIESDQTGNILGTFRAAEYNFFVGFARNWRKNFSYGAQLKFIYSQLEAYHSTGLATDIGGTYVSNDKRFSAAVVFRNIGYQIKPYASTREPMPFEIQAGVAFKPQHLPFRFSVITHHLETPNISYINSNLPVQTDLNGTVIPQKVGLVDKVARHFIFGAELLAGKVLAFQVGYNDQRRMELSIPGLRGAVGFSFGVSLNLGKFYIAYGQSFMHISGSSETFSFGLNLAQILKKKDKDAEQQQSN